MARTPAATMKALLNENPQTQYGFAVGQLPNLLGIVGNSPGTLATTQLMFPDVLSYRISRSQDQQSDTCTLTFADDYAKYLSTNKNATRGKFFYPGPIEKKITFYLGYKGPINSGKSNFTDYVQAAVTAFTGFVETDASAQSPFMLDKTVTLNDLTSQFKFQVYDTFPHALFGNQTLSYYDPTYNLTSTDGINWQCIGRMFTSDSNDPVWGATNMPVLVFVDTTGDTPQNTALGGPNNYASPPTYPATIGADQDGYFNFDFSNGIIQFTSAGLTHLGYPSGLPTTSAVSVQGNPTYMAPETMIYKLLVEKAGWDPSMLDLQVTNLLLPMFDGQDRSVWDCLSSVAAMTASRFLPWKLWADEDGVIHFYETNLDSPPKRYWINGSGVFTANHEYTARDIRTVVRGDGQVAIAGTNGYDSGSDQSVTSIAYDNKAIAEYGLTEPMLLSTDVTDSIRHLTPTQAVAHLNLVAQSVLYQTSRPQYTITVDGVPDPFVQIGDKVHYTDDSIGVDDEFEIIQIERSNDGKEAQQQTTLQQYYETINFNLGVPAGISDDPDGTGATQAPPNSAIIGAVKMGTNPPLYVFKNGDYTRDINNNPIVPIWEADDLTDAMHFDYMLWSKAKAEGNHNPYNYNNLPPVAGGTWESEQDHTGATVYYIPHATGPGGNGNTYYVGPDSVFYQYNNSSGHSNPGAPPGNGDYHIGPFDLSYKWTPPGNQNDDGGGRSGKGYDVYVWAWWYLCLDSTVVDPNTSQPYWSEPFKEKDGRLLMRFVDSHNGGGSNPNIDHVDGKKITVPDNSSIWMYNTWRGGGNILYPGPWYGHSGATKLYKNLVVGCTDYTTPPNGFIGANVMQDGVNVGVAYGPDAGSSNTYVNYEKKTKGHFCLYALDSDGGSQFLRIPFWMKM